ncbi:hypothetical protein GCM10023063_17230 [Arthrobacter methylotrophus]
MFQGMSINPPESTGPAAPGPTEPATGPAGRDGKPTAGDQAKADGADVAVAALKGAATGGLTGAAVGALKGAVKTKTGRNVAIAAIAAPILAVSLLASLVFGAMQAITATPSGREANANTAALASFSNKTDFAAIQDAAVQGGVPWEVIAGVYQTVKNKSGDKGTGPFGIDLKAAGSEISEADANNINKAAVYVARKLKKSSQDTIDKLPNPALDAGYMDTRGDKGEDILKPVNTDEAKAIRDKVKTEYVAALKTVPLTGNPATAESAFDGSINLMSAAPASKCSPATVNIGGPSAATLNPKQTAYAQAIVNQVAAKGMPEQAAVIALAVALRESGGLQMYWNPNVPGSQELSDGGPEGGKDLAPPQISYSVGLFQQQVNGSEFHWGTVQDAMNPAKSADMFLDALLRVPGWQDMPVTVAAQAVQGSAFPDAYAAYETQARTIMTTVKPTTGSYGTTTKSAPPAGGAVPASAATSSCLAGGVGTGAVGKGDDYPFKDAMPDLNDPWGTLNRECVSFVAWRMNVQMGWKPGQDYPFTVPKLGVGLWGDAVGWKDTVGSVYPMNNTPKVGAVAWFDKDLNRANGQFTTGAAGHVAVVSAVNNDGTIDIEQYNFIPYAYNAMRIPAAWVSGFIHVADIDSTKN